MLVSFSNSHKNVVDLGVSNHALNNITQNAKVSDSRFRNIAFSPVPIEKSGRSQLAATIEALENFILRRKAKSQETEYGTWLWTPIMQITPSYMADIIAKAKKEGVNVIYLSLDSYLDIYVMEEGKEKEKALEQFSKKLEDFIWLASGEGIEVDAEGGWSNWTEEGHKYKGYALVSFVKDFNKSRAHQFRGFQYDVEPYLLEEYQASVEGKKRVLSDFIALVDETEHFLSDSNLQFSVVVPDFYDRKDKATPKFSYGGRTDSVFGHLVQVLNKREGSKIIIMSYRNFAHGRDGSIEVTDNEMRTLRNKGGKTDIVIALETGDVEPSYITFFSTSKSYFENEKSKVVKKYKNHPNFGGLSIHFANSFFSLR